MYIIIPFYDKDCGLSFWQYEVICEGAACSAAYCCRTMSLAI